LTALARVHYAASMQTTSGAIILAAITLGAALFPGIYRLHPVNRGEAGFVVLISNRYTGHAWWCIPAVGSSHECYSITLPAN